MTKLVIHIGLQKTGTTFLQKNFLGRAKLLRNHGVHYLNPRGNLPTQKNSAAHHWLVAAIRGIPNDYIPDVPFSFLPDYVANLRRKISQTAEPIALMSSENFSRMNEAQVAMLRRHFEGIDCEIVIYLRRQDVWIDAWYAQLVKTGRKITLEETIEEMRDFLDYRNLIDRWAKSFGAENIRLGVFENMDSPRMLWSDFFRTLDRPKAGEIELKEENANVTLAPQLTKFIELAQETTGYSPRLRRFLEDVNGHFARIDTLKFLRQERAEAILADCESCNREIARKFFGREHLFANRVVRGSEYAEELTTADLVNVLAGSNLALLERIANLERALEQQTQNKKL